MLEFPWNVGGGGGGSRAATGSGAGSASQPLADYVAPSPVWSQSLQLQAESYYSNSKGSSVKARAIIILGFLLVCAMAFGQPDSTVYVKNFRGNDVGTKVFNAMQTCTTNTLVPCYLVVDPTLAATAPGTLPTLCNHCYLVDWRYGIPSGSGSITGLSSLDPTHLPVAQSGQAKTLNLVNVDKLDLSNVHLTGGQTVLTGAASNVGRQVQGFGVSSVNIVSHFIGSQCHGNYWTPNVVAGEWMIAYYVAGSGSAPTSALGNTFSFVASGSAFQSQIQRVYVSHVTHSGTDSIYFSGGSNCDNTDAGILVQGLPPTAYYDNSVFYESAPYQASVTTSVTTTYSNDFLVAFSSSSNTACTNTVSSGFTTIDPLTTTGNWTAQTAYQVTGLPGTYSATLGYSGPGGCSSANVENALVAFRVLGYSTQAADLDQWLDSQSDVLSRVDSNGAFNPPLSSGTPVNTPGFGAIEYDTLGQHAVIYDAGLGWVNLAYQTTAGLVAGTNGYYRIDGDGTITEYVNTGALNNNTPTTVTLPHSFPSLIASIVCSDNGGRVQAGNDQPVGANAVGLSAPYGQIYVNSPATGMSAYCVVVGK